MLASSYTLGSSMVVNDKALTPWPALAAVAVSPGEKQNVLKSL
jgi:hypothetical protein